MSDFETSPEAEVYAERILQVDEYYDLLKHAFERCGVGTEPMPFYEVEDRIVQELKIQDVETLELILSSVLPELADHTSLVQLEEMRMHTHGEILNECMKDYFGRVLLEMAS